MGRAWDILPPYKPVHNVKHGSKAKSARGRNKNASVFFVLIIVIFVGIFIFATSKNTPVNTSGTNSPPNRTTSQESTSPATSEKNPDQLKIKVLNGTGRSEETVQVVAILNEIGFKVTKTENALSLYDQTIVYFESNQEKYAQEIAQSLTKYKAKTQKFSQDSPYDLIIVIGAQ